MTSRGQITKVLMVSFVRPFPSDSGKKVVLQSLIQYFLRRPNTRVDYLILEGNGATPPAEARLTFHWLSHETRRMRLLMALMRSVLRRRPLQQTLLYSARLRRGVREQVAAIKPDIIVYDTIRVSQFVESPRALSRDARHILYLDDLFSVRYRATLRAMEEYPRARVNPLGNFAQYLPKFVRPLLNARRLCRFLLRREMRLVETVEVADVAKFDVSLLVNRDEVKLLQQRSAHDRIATLPVILPRQSRPLPVRAYHGNPEFVFIGALNVAHNQCSIEYFIATIFDDCVKRMSGFKLRIIGQSPSQDLRRLFVRHEANIEWTEWVADLGNVFAGCAAMIVPLLFGSGVKVKTLEALRYALPVISTPFGAEGIVRDSTEASGIIIENDLRRFPERMLALLDRQQNDRLSHQAHEFYAANYGVEAIAEQYQRLFGV